MIITEKTDFEGGYKLGSKLIKFDVVSFPKARVIGKSVNVNVDIGIDDHTIEDLWASMADDGSLEFLFNLPKHIGEKFDTVGWEGDFKPGDTKYTYLAGRL